MTNSGMTLPMPGSREAVLGAEIVRLRAVEENLERRLAEREVLVGSFRLAAMKWLEMLETYGNRNSSLHDERTAVQLERVNRAVDAHPGQLLVVKQEIKNMEQAHAIFK